MSFQKTKVEGIPLTLELAREFAMLRPLPGEREERPSRREYLLNAIKEGTFGGPSWARGIDRADKMVYRLDGQHSSKLLINLDDVPFPSGLLVTVDTWEFDSISEDGAALFNLFNHPKSARTNEDAIGIYRAQAAIELSNIDRGFLVKVGNGIAEYERGLPSESNPDVLPPRERGLYFIQGKHRYGPFACWMAAFEETKNASFMSRPAIVAEMLSDWLHDAGRAGEFWNYVLRENHPEVDHDTRTLAETFRSWAMQKKYKASQYRGKAATAWRHYLRETRGSSKIEPRNESVIPELGAEPRTELPPDQLSL